MNPLPKLYIGNRNYSSWSLRPWLFLRTFGVAFEDEVIALDTPEFRHQIARVSPTLRVPVLIDGDTSIWDSLAICLYAADRWVGSRALPPEMRARAMALSITAEMHSGFSALRTHCPMNIRRRRSSYELPDAARADADRVQGLWRECRQKFGAGGDFLFGAFSLADAFYAPVVTRFLSYAVPMDSVSARYAEAIMDLPGMREWCTAAVAETWVIEATERIGA
ncbi:MAG: glutathione S-transferase family protein [Pseudomonadota bacterium]|nr:glutathione S-transferase family protein [Pseudomonadota bacterium]